VTGNIDIRLNDRWIGFNAIYSIKLVKN